MALLARRRARGRTSIALAAALALVAAACGGAAPPPPMEPGAPVVATSAEADHTPALATVPVRTRFELPVDVRSRTLAPDEVRIEALFTSPSGAVVTTGGFASHGSHRVRFAAREVGLHGYVIRADAGEGLHEVARGQFEAVASAASGFVSRDPAQGRRLVRDGGETVRVLGESRIEIGGRTGEVDVQGYLSYRASQGMRTIRAVVSSSLEPSAGRFDEKTADAIDALFDGAERSRVDVVLVAFARGRGRNGRPPEEMFTSPVQRGNAARRLRYVADRWGASPRLLALELVEEPELDEVVPEATWRPWAEAMRDAWRSSDPYRHLFTSGQGVVPTGDDLVLVHLHGAGRGEAPRTRESDAMHAIEVAYGREEPVICADFDETAASSRPWALTFAGAGVLVPRGARLGVLSLFLGAFQAAPLDPARDVRVSRGKAKASSLVTPDALARGFWVQSASEADGRAVSGVELALPAPPAGRYAVTWIDDATGKTIASSTLDSRGSGDVRLPVPAFTGHVAGRMNRDVPLAEHAGAPSP